MSGRRNNSSSNKQRSSSIGSSSRWGRSSRRQQRQRQQQDEEQQQNSYRAPSHNHHNVRITTSSSSTAAAAAAAGAPPMSTSSSQVNTTSTNNNNTKSLTHGISTLFRRAEKQSSASSNTSPRRSSRRGRRSSRRQQDDDDMISSSSYSNTAASRSTMSNDAASSSLYATTTGTSTTTNSMLSSPPSTSRLFYSADAMDSSSDDSFESRISSAVSASDANPTTTSTTSGTDKNNTAFAAGAVGTATSTTTTTPGGGDGNGGNDSQQQQQQRVIVRYRGFSTSLSSLFLDEPLVCASMGCFGLLLSNRTEYLLQVRQEKRGMQSRKGRGRRRHRLGNPSKLMAHTLLLTLLLMTTTFIIWGFGNGQNDAILHDYHNGVDADNYNDDNNGNNNNENNNNENNNGNDNNENNNNEGQENRRHLEDLQHLSLFRQEQRQHHQQRRGHRVVQGIWSLCDYHEHVWSPILELLDNEWNRNDDPHQNSSRGGGRHARRRDRHGQGGLSFPPTIARLVATTFDTTNTTTSWSKGGDTTTPSHRFLEDNNNNNEEDGNGQNDDGNYNDDDALDDDQEQQHERNIGAHARMALGLAFLVFLGIVGRKRRMRTRYALIRARAQEDHLYYASNVDHPAVSLQNTREDQFDGACSHTLCGCYPVDPKDVQVPTEDVEETYRCTSIVRSKHKHQAKHGDCVSRGFQLFLSCCCGVLCKCWFQCLSVCSLAQEAREMRLLLPPRFQRIDYITHQPFIEYQKDVNDLRRGWMGKTRRKAGIMPHFYALSKLSRYILMGFTGVVVVILLTLLFNPRAAFSLPDAIVLLATFGQSFLVIYIVHWIFHKSDLSLDAVIKFFATGFLIATPTAFFFEGLIVNVILVVSYSFYSLFAWMIGEAFVDFIANYWRVFWILGELVNAYLVAAVTEELCKYYSFRAVEHPDLIFLTGLDREANDSNAVDGGHIKYSFSSHQVSKLNRSTSFSSMSSHRSTVSQTSSLSRNDYAIGDAIMRTTTEEEFYEDDNDARTYRQKAAAVTTGMIGVAVGLACAENFLYVFVLGGAQDDSSDDHSGGVLEEWIVLLFRSVFPIHALAAAMQSINMIRKFVECTEVNNHRIGVGRIILPAVILHGTFDAILMAINVFIESSWDKYLEENDGNEGDGTPYDPLVVNLVAWASIICIMLMGMLWYYRENRLQRNRLKLLEERDKAKEEGGGNKNLYEGPSSSSEVELV